MTKDVFVSVSGLQFGEAEPDRVETIYKGTYYQKDGKHYVLYDEIMEGFDKPVKSMMKFAEGSLTVNKKGAINVNMIFEEHKNHVCCYGTPYGELMIGIHTTSLKMKEQKNSITIDAVYTLEAGNQPLAACQIRVKITESPPGFTL